ncbi:hypothetical protein [Planococcus faecalis]|uniref:hypothetical protein n=1 Tax=Planococcus faecalis TaxID=1598147 RepID=UPI000AC20576|nr:hypothetical protein [Planococcus faecalis]
MAALLFFFLENMALIIALLYLALKAKELLFPNLTESKFLYLLSVVFISFLTFSVMYNPYFYMGMRLDLREVPLYFISYIAGWKVGLLSAIFPAYFRYLSKVDGCIGYFANDCTASRYWQLVSQSKIIK